MTHVLKYDLRQLKVCTQNCIDYFRSVQAARLPPAGSMLDNGEPYSPLDTSASNWSLGDLPRLQEIAEMLQDGASDLQQIASGSEAESQKLQASALQREWILTVSHQDWLTSHDSASKIGGSRALPAITRRSCIGPIDQDATAQPRTAVKSITDTIIDAGCRDGFRDGRICCGPSEAECE